MIPDTKSGLPAMACVSAMQKAIRRGMEREAMEFACELMHTSKAFHSMVCNRLEVICHEDLDTLAAPHVFPFVVASLVASRERYSKSIGEARLMIGNAIRMMARAPKSRAGCHFAAAIRTARQARRLCSDCMTRSTRLHVFVQHQQHPGQKQKHRGNNGMPPKHEGHPKDCNDESNQCHPATSK